MTELIIVAVYIISIFISRHFNKMLYKIKEIEIHVVIWFIPILNVAILVTGIILNIDKFKSRKRNWFTGENWKKND